jgi:hypothetical protein
VQKEEFRMHACKFFIQICKQTKLLRKWTLINFVNFVGTATVISSTLSLVKALRPRGRQSCELVLAGHDEIGGRSDQGGVAGPSGVPFMIENVGILPQSVARGRNVDD